MAATEGPARANGQRSASRAKQETAPMIPVEERLMWRAVVRTGIQLAVSSRERDRVEWHLAACEAPHAEGSHCPEGMRLIDTIGHPDGHCLIDGRCGRCGKTARASTRKAA